jgi:amino acid transporter
MSEEATNAARAVPLGILWSSGLCGILGFLSLAVIAAVINTDLEAVMGTAFGQPMAQVGLSFTSLWRSNDTNALSVDIL